MSIEQKTEDSKSTLPVLMTPKLMELKITSDLAARKLNISDVLKKEQKLVFNEDNLQEMKEVLKDCDLIDKSAEEVHKKVKAPYWDAGKACDAGKNLVLSQTSDIRNRVKPKYDKLLKDIADRALLQQQKEAQNRAILKGIDDSLIVFAQKIVAATSTKALQDVENLINLQKSPSMAKKYGDFHPQAIERFDTVLKPIIKDQKEKVKEIEALNKQREEAEASNDPDKMDEIDNRINDLSDQVLQNNAVVEEAALNQESFAIVEAVEVLPDFKVKRTNFSYEIADLDVALKKSRDLLEISIDSKMAKLKKDALVAEGAFEGKDEVVRDGIRYIATRVREAL